MGNTFVDGQEKVGMDSALDFVTVRNSVGRLVFMGQRKNIKCFDKLKKVSDRVFETLAGQTYKFLDKMPEPEKPKELEITPEMRAKAEASWRLHCMVQEAGSIPESPKPKRGRQLSFDEQIEHDWRHAPSLRKEFVTFGSYQAYKRAEKAGRTRVCGVS